MCVLLNSKVQLSTCLFKVTALVVLTTVEHVDAELNFSKNLFHLAKIGNGEIPQNRVFNIISSKGCGCSVPRSDLRVFYRIVLQNVG